MNKLNIDISVLDKLFPFLFVVDSLGRIVHAAPSIKKLAEVPISNNANFKDIFTVIRPQNIELHQLIHITQNEMITLKLNSPKAEFMGQIMNLEDPSLKLFIMNLVVQDPDELTGLNLDFNDFAIQDPIFDYLMLLQTQRRAIRQADEANAQLVKAHDIAVKASETKSQFLANMSHELRTPMNGLLGMASILQDTPLDNEQKDYVQTLVTSGESMLALINDILDLSKIEAGYISLEKERVDIRALLNEIQNTVLPMVNKKNLNFNLNIDKDIPENIEGDRTRLRQVILNLVGNAVKFTSVGAVTVTLSKIDTQQIEIKVTDSGIGMSRETLNKIFSPFVQGDSSMTKQFEGTGLGLSICKKLVEAMDGKISVASKEGEGSEFKVQINFKEFCDN